MKRNLGIQQNESTLSSHTTITIFTSVTRGNALLFTENNPVEASLLEHHDSPKNISITNK